MPFLAFSNTNINFAWKELTWRSYTILKALLTTRQVKVIDQKEFAVVTLDPEKKAFVVHVAFFSLGSRINPAWEAQIGALNSEKVVVPPEYSDYADVFSKAFAMELLEHTNINDHPINPVDNKQLP